MTIDEAIVVLENGSWRDTLIPARMVVPQLNSELELNKAIDTVISALRSMREVKQNDSQIGLHGKYVVRKNSSGEYVSNCFVLRPDKDAAAVVALRAYAKATDNGVLASDIANWVGVEKNEPLTQDQLRMMNCEIVYCLELNTNVKVLAPGRGFIEIYYELPCSRGTLKAKDVTLYRTNPNGE